MASHDRILCKKCRGDNDRGARFCWYCGAPLRGGARRSRVQEVAIDLATRASKWVLFLAVLAGLVVGAYYALDHYLWPAVGSETTIAQTAPTTAVPKTTTTVTTLPPRSDRTVAGGTDRYATAIGISKLAFPEGAPALVLVPGDDYAQGMVVAPLAAAYKGAVLLVPPDGIREDLAVEIARLAPTQVFLVGTPKPNTITRQLEETLKTPTVTRLIGEDAYETAALVAGAVRAKVGAVSKVVVVPSDSFVEALSVAPLAAANGWPILLTPRVGSVPRTTRNAIADLGATSALVVGTDAELTLDQVDRQMGADSFETAALVVRYAVTQGLTFAHTAIVTGASFPDGVITGSYLALDRGILILIKEGEQPGSPLSVLTANLGDVRVLDFIALPQLAKQMAAGSAGTASTTTTASGPNGSGASGNSKPSTEGTTQTTTRPSAGGW
jgi:putative cell wall-binding protein